MVAKWVAIPVFGWSPTLLLLLVNRFFIFGRKYICARYFARENGKFCPLNVLKLFYSIGRRRKKMCSLPHCFRRQRKVLETPHTIFRAPLEKWPSSRLRLGFLKHLNKSGIWSQKSVVSHWNKCTTCEQELHKLIMNHSTWNNTKTTSKSNIFFNIASPEVGWQLKKILPCHSKLVPSVRKNLFIQGLARLSHARKKIYQGKIWSLFLCLIIYESDRFLKATSTLSPGQKLF